MRTENDIKDMARAQTRMVLGESTQFLQMPHHEQERLYREVYGATFSHLARQNGLARQFATDPLDPENFDNDRIEQAGQLAADFIQDVDFPGFVRDLIHGVFRANIEVMHEQTNDFMKVLKLATKSLAEFVNKIDDTSSFAYLAETEPDSFSLQLPPIPEDGSEPAAAPGQPVLTDKQGEPLDLGDNMVKAKIMDAKIAMAREQRALLREVLLMGITRLVVEEGNINAAVVFDIKARENIVRTGQRANERVRTSGGNVGGSFFGLFGGGRSNTERKTEITVSSAKGTANTDLAAKITGSVAIKFKTDYFKLDNFAQMYGPTPAQPAAVGANGAVGAGRPAVLQPQGGPLR